MTVDRTNHIWSVSNLQRVFIVSWLIVPTIFGMSVIYNVILSCDGKVSHLFLYFLYMADSMKRPASVGLAQAHPNHDIKSHDNRDIHKWYIVI